MSESTRFAPGVRGRAVRMVSEHRDEHESRWAAIVSMSEKFGCAAETLRNCVRHTACDEGSRRGPTGEERDRVEALEREVRELRGANEILRKAPAHVAQAELDRRSK